MLNLQALFQESGGFGTFQVLVCIAGFLVSCFAASVISGSAFCNLVACSGLLNVTVRTNDSSLAIPVTTDRTEGNNGTRHGFQTSVSVEYQLCDGQVSLGELSSVFLLAGCIPGSILAGPAADTLGRIPCTAIGLFGTVTMNVVATFAPYFWLHLASRMICGFFISWAVASIYVYGNEVMMTAHRSRFVKIFNLGSSIGCIALALLAYVLRDYKLMMTANNFMAIPLVLTLAFLPESPSWLVSQRNGYQDQVKVKLAMRRIAWINRCHPPALESLQLSEARAPKDQEPGRIVARHESRRIGASFCDEVKSLVSDRKVMAQLFVTCFYGFSSGFSYYGFTFVITQAVPDIYTTVALMGAVESLSPLFLNVFSRSRALLYSALATVTLCIAISTIFMFVPAVKSSPGVAALVVGLSVAGKFVTNLTFGAIMVVGVEIFPTAARNTGLAFIMATLRIGCMLAPLVNLIPSMSARFGAIGLSCLLAAIPITILPDTRARDLTAAGPADERENRN